MKMKSTTKNEKEKNIYTCNFCGFSEDWEETDEKHGEMWSCEVCGQNFCSKCFIDKFGRQKYYDMMQSGEYIRCPECFRGAEADVRKSIPKSQSLREQISADTQNSISKYLFCEHRDLIAFAVGAEEISHLYENVHVDFDELVVVVDKDWLFSYMNKENPRKFLQDEYVSEDSIDWFMQANLTEHLALVKFN